MHAKGEDAVITALPIAYSTICSGSVGPPRGNSGLSGKARHPYPARAKIASTYMAQAPTSASGFGAEKSPLSRQTPILRL